MNTPRLLSVGLLCAVIATGCATEHHHHSRRAVQHDQGTRIEDPNHDCHVTFEDGRIAMRIPGTAHDFAAELERWNAPRVLAPVTGDFIIEVKVSGNFHPGEKSTIDGRRPYNGAGLLIVADKQHHLSLQRGAVRLGDRVRHYANFELRKDGQVSSFDFDIEDADVWLRLEKHGRKIFASASEDRVSWRSFAPIDADFPPTVRAGVVGISSSKTPFSCKFGDLALYKRARLQPNH